MPLLLFQKPITYQGARQYGSATGSWEGSAVDFMPAQSFWPPSFTVWTRPPHAPWPPCPVLRRQPFCDLGSTIHFVPEIVLALQTWAKPINILECYCSQEQEVKCYNLTFGPDLLQVSPTDRRMLIKMNKCSSFTNYTTHKHVHGGSF